MPSSDFLPPSCFCNLFCWNAANTRFHAVSPHTAETKVKMGRFSKSQSPESCLQSEARVSVDCLHSETNPSASLWSSRHKSDMAGIVVLVMAPVHSLCTLCLSLSRVSADNAVLLGLMRFHGRSSLCFRACAGTGWEDSTLCHAVRLSRIEQRVVLLLSKTAFRKKVQVE